MFKQKYNISAGFHLKRRLHDLLHTISFAFFNACFSLSAHKSSGFMPVDIRITRIVSLFQAASFNNANLFTEFCSNGGDQDDNQYS